MLVNKFQQIVSVDISSLEVQKLSSFSKAPVLVQKSNSLEGLPADTDALLVSLLVPVKAADLERLSQLRYIGVYGTSQRRIDLVACKERGIHVSSVQHYCDYETAEAIINYILMYFRRTGDFQNLKKPIRSLANKKIGIIGLGQVGIELAKLSTAMGMKVRYFSRSRKLDLEQNYKMEFQILDKLLQDSDVVSLHTPPNLLILDKAAFSQLNPQALLVNTCPGDVLDWNAFHQWIQNTEAFAIFDHFVKQNMSSDLSSGAYFMKEQAYRTEESIARLQKLFLQNLINFLNQAEAI